MMLNFQGSRSQTRPMSAFVPYLPRLVLDWSRDEGARVREVEGTLVSVDLSGFTRLSERLQAKGRAGAEELVLAVSGIFQGLIGICERHGGDVLKFRGDALLLFFSNEGHERRACLASSHMQWLIGEAGTMMSSVGSVTLRMSTGVYTGTCHFFLVEGTHRELVVTGPAGTATIGLESEASAGQILISERTAAAIETAWLGAKRPGGRLLRKLDEEDVDVEAHLASVLPDASDELGHYIPEPLRAQLVLEAGEAEHRQVTAAFIKFSGVDALLAAEGSDAVLAQLDALAGLVGETTAELGLTWLESDIDVGGGKLYLVGGAPSSTGADEERMLRALRAVLDGHDGLTLRAGVNRGPAFCGDVGAETRRTYAVIGDTVNLAARLTSRADAGGILATADVLDRASTRFETTPQPFLFKGKERPITAYRVGASLGEKEEEAQAELPFVGRDAELATFALSIAAARVRQQQFVELIGEPGIGKSRLTEELKRQSLGFTQLLGRCDQYSSASPYSVFRELLRPLAGITPDLDAAEAGAHLAPWIEAVMPDLAPLLPLLAIPFGADVPSTPETDQIDAQFRRVRLNELVDVFLTRVLMMPTLIVIEDAHWIDDASRELIMHLTRAPAPRPWLVCVTRRPQGSDLARDDVAGHVRLALGPLPPDLSQSLALSAAGNVAFAQDVMSALVERAGGNPLFLRELVAASRGATNVDSLPDSVETVILTRMDTLPPEDRFLLRNASVLGSRFELDLLTEVLAVEMSDVGDLERWEHLSEFVAWEGAGALTFMHDLFRAVAYEGLSFKRRREMHTRVGRALEARAGDKVDEVAELLSLHYYRADNHEGAWHYSVLAGARAQKRSANIEAVELYERALDVASHVEASAEEVARVAEALGDAAELGARYEQAQKAYARARKLVPDDLISQARLLRKEGILRERLGRYSEALRWYGRALRRVESAPNHSSELASARADLALAYAGVKLRQGRFDESRDWADRAAAATDDRTRLAHAHYLAHIAAVRSGRRDPEHRDSALAILEEVGDLVRLSSLQNNVGVEAYFDGRWDDALEWYRRSGDSALRVGDVVNVARAQNNEAEILSDQGMLDDASALFDEALRVWRAAKYGVGVALATSNLGRAAARAGRFDEARALLDDAVEQFRALGAEQLIVEAEVRLAECLVFEGRHKDASKAVERLRSTNASTYTATLERLAGYAVIQSRAPFARAKPHFDASLEAAQAAKAPYEAALTLLAVAQTGGQASGEAEEILARLGVVSTPRVPLP
jgi:class 3 adenylate cyclase/tetratricopeptide (TPR) repeat protein